MRVGRYELLTELARGGMAVLHLARLSGVGGFSKLVAVKLILPHLSQNEHYVKLFLNEGRIAARISHPNVCHVFEIGEENGQLFLVMEYLEGVTWEQLAQVLPPDPVLKLRALTGIFAQACDGLQAAHDVHDTNGAPAPVIHRDVSPQNLFVTVDGACKVLDFGVAKMKSIDSHTRSSVLKGKVPYMSPEQLRGEDIDTRTDVFATGVVLWEALANRPLFVREVEFQTWKAITEGKIDPISAWEPHYGADVDAVVLRALERDRELRYPAIRELGDELRKLGAAYGGAFTPAEIAELVRSKCAPQLEARQREIAALDVDDEPTSSVDVSSGSFAHNAPTELGIALRAETVSLGHVPPSRRGGKWLALAALLAVAAVAITVVAWPSRRDEQAAVARAKIEPPASSSGTHGARQPESAPETESGSGSEPAPASAPAPNSGAGSGSEPAPVPDSGSESDSGSASDSRSVSDSGSESAGASASDRRRDPKSRDKAPPRHNARDRTRAVRSDEPAPSPPAITDSRPGWLSIDARPSARVYIDGTFIDETPIYRHSLAPGWHEVRIVPAKGKATTRSVTIKPAELLNLGTIQ